MNTQEIQTKTKDFIENILQKLDHQDATVAVEIVEEDEDIAITANVSGDQVDLLIGYHGRNLSALHSIVLSYLKRVIGKSTKKIMLHVDIGEYYSKQDEKVIRQVQEAIEDVRLLQEPYELQPMPPRMRRLIHMEISKHADLRSESIGEGDSRRVVIHPNNAGTTN